MADLIPQHHPVNIEDEMKRSYMDYAMSVIIGRALPDARDGLKPAPSPNLPVNGPAGIAVGRATNVPPHNLREVVDGCIWLIENMYLGDAQAAALLSRGEKLKQLIRLIPGPDFPTAGFIIGRGGI